MALILVVDDEKPIREVVAHALEGAGHHVLQAIHGRDALSVIAGARPERPDLVLADVMMPLVGGAELCRALKVEPATTGIPVVLMSAAVAHVGAGEDAFIAKPFNLDALEALVGGVLAAHRAAADASVRQQGGAAPPG